MPLSTVHTGKSKVNILQNFVAFSENMNFKYKLFLVREWFILSLIKQNYNVKIFIRFVHSFYTNCSGSGVQIPSAEGEMFMESPTYIAHYNQTLIKCEIFSCLKLNKCMSFTFHYYSFWVQGAFLAQSLKARNQNHNGQIRASIRPKSFLNSSIALEH